MKAGLVYSPVYLEHNREDHPENKQRLIALIEFLQRKNEWDKFRHIAPRPASEEEIGLNHSLDYIHYVREGAEKGLSFLDADTYICRDSYKSALFAAGGVLEAIDHMINKEVEKVFCLIRPPGHHAINNQAMGFCLFNNIAVGAKYALKKYCLQRILIVDFDLHHGNGTQESFYEDDRVLYVSLHQFPYYPGSGGKEEKGRGKGLGWTINIPLSAGNGDQQYIRVLREILYPAALKFNPELILVSAGFDAYVDDPLGGMEVTEKGYEEIGRIIKEISARTSPGVISCLEGGYSLKGLPLCFYSYMQGMTK